MTGSLACALRSFDKRFLGCIGWVVHRYTPSVLLVGFGHSFCSLLFARLGRWIPGDAFFLLLLFLSLLLCFFSASWTLFWTPFLRFDGGLSCWAETLHCVDILLFSSSSVYTFIDQLHYLLLRLH
jgi:hypothetical protein